MSRSEALFHWLEDKSDWLSPIVVKETRQIVSGREFGYSVGASLIAGVAVAFFGAADALTGKGTSGGWTFVALMGCLSLLGLAVVPLGAFTALRNERLEQTLELITLTALSPRRVVIGKLLAQGVKLTTLFSAMAPFVAMSFLLGGIDFVTILLSLLFLFMWSLWMCAACLFLSTLLKSRAVGAVAFGIVGIVLFLVFGLGMNLFVVARRMVFFGGGAGFSASQSWMILAIAATASLTTMVNLVLLAENRLSLPTEDRVTPLRVGFLMQFLLIAGWTLAFINEPARVQENALEALGVIGGLHLAIVAMFTVTEDLVVPRRVFLRMQTSATWRWLLAVFRPGGGRGAAYVLAQMVLLLSVASLFHPSWIKFRWLLAICGYICFFTGVPTLAYRLLRPAHAASLKLRIAVLVLVSLSMVLPDVFYYVLWQPEVLDLRYSTRHLLNPLRTLANWHRVENDGWFFLPFALSATGLAAYLALIHVGTRMTAQSSPIDSHRRAPAAGEPDSANVLY